MESSRAQSSSEYIKTCDSIRNNENLTKAEWIHEFYSLYSRNNQKPLEIDYSRPYHFRNFYDLEEDQAIRGMAFSPCSNFVATLTKTSIKVWELQRNKIEFSLRINISDKEIINECNDVIGYLYYSNDGKSLIRLTLNLELSKLQVKISNLQEQKEVFSLSSDQLDTNSHFSISQDHSRLAYISNNILKVFNLQNFSEEFTLSKVTFNSFCLSSDDNILITFKENSLKFWNFQTKVNFKLKMKKNSDLSLLSTNNKKILIIESEDDLEFFDLQEKKILFQVENFGFSNKTIFSNDGNFVVFVGNKQIFVENLKNSRRNSLKGLEHFILTFVEMQFSFNSQFLVVSLSDEIFLWKKKIQPPEFESPSFSLKFICSSFLFSPDSRNLALLEKNGSLTLVEIPNEFQIVQKGTSGKSLFPTRSLNQPTESKNPENLKNSSKILKKLEKINIFPIFTPKYSEVEIKERIKQLKQKLNFSSHGSISQDFEILSFSPKKKFISTFSKDFSIKFLEIEEKNQNFSLKNSKIIRFLSHSSDLNFAVVEFTNGVISVWNIEEKKEEFKLFPQEVVILTVLSFNGNYLAVHFLSNILKIWKIFENREILNFSFKDIESFGFSPEGRFFLVAFEENTILVFDLKSRSEFLRIFHHFWHLKFSKNFLFSHDDCFLMINQQCKKVKIWDLMEKTEIEIGESEGYDYGLSAFSNKNKLFAIFRPDMIEIWDLQEKTLNHEEESSKITSILFSPDGKVLAWELEKSIKILNIQNKQLQSICLEKVIPSLNLSTFRFIQTGLSFSDEGKVLFYGTFDKELFFYQQGENLKVFKFKKNFKVNSIFFNKKKKVFVIEKFYFFVEVWNLEDFQKKMIQNRFEEKILLKFSNNEEKLAIDLGMKKVVFDLLKESEEFVFEEKDEFCFQSFGEDLDDFYGNSFRYSQEEFKKIVFFPREEFFAFESENGVINVWDAVKRLPVFILGEHFGIRGLFVSTREDFLASVNYEKIKIWNLIDRCVYLEIYGTCTCITFTSDSLFCAINDDQRIKILNLSTKRLIISLNHCIQTVKNMIFTNEDQILWISGNDVSFKFAFSNKLFSLLNEDLHTFIKQRENLNDLLNDMKVALRLYDYDNYFTKAKLTAEKKFNELASKIFITFYINKCNNLAEILVKFIMDYAAIGIFLYDLNPNAMMIIENHLKKVFKDIIEDCDVKILMFLIDCCNEIKFKAQLKQDLEKLNDLKHFFKKKVLNMNPSSNFEIEEKINNESLQKAKLYQSKQKKFYEVKLSTSKLEFHTVLIKEYILKSDLPKETKEKLIFEFKKEAKCYQILEKSICNYFSCLNSTKIFLTMIESHKSLKKSLKDLNFQNKLNDLHYFKKILNSLIHSFAILSSKNILHRQICPKSLQITSNFEIKIINFLFASVKINESWHVPEKSLLTSTSQLYRSPEESSNENLDLEKCDVYSLGLVIIELASLENIRKIKENLKSCLDDLRMGKFCWLWPILRNMLLDCPQDRPSFLELSLFRFNF